MVTAQRPLLLSLAVENHGRLVTFYRHIPLNAVPKAVAAHLTVIRRGPAQAEAGVSSSQLCHLLSDRSCCGGTPQAVATASRSRVPCYFPAMTTLRNQIPNLSTSEKLAAMEALWSSLHQTFENSPPPDWHREVLENRMKLIQSGDAVYEDWDKVKKQLRERTA